MNGRLTSIQSQTGTRGDGERVLSVNLIVVPIPANIKDPTSFRRSTDRSEGIEVDVLIVISREAMRRQGHIPAVGDRVGYLQNHLAAVAMVGDVVTLKSLGDDTVIELGLKQRHDRAVVGGAP